ncbi:MAG: hypothetical protein CL570_08570 [Alphaproteobacteria bacterium]|nr:hypothetical protein [Alphaproteobacteria bacterium]
MVVQCFIESILRAKRRALDDVLGKLLLFDLFTIFLSKEPGLLRRYAPRNDGFENSDVQITSIFAKD